MNNLSGKGRVLCFDAEAIGLLDDVRPNQKNAIHVIHVSDKESKELFTFFDDYEDRINAVHLGEEEDKKSGTIADGLQFLKEADCVISQNGSGYDYLLFRKTYPDLWSGINYTKETTRRDYPYYCMDTLVMSQVLNPERSVPQQAYDVCRRLGIKLVGAHSIASHGIRIGRFKPEHEDWSRLTKAMLHRVREDVAIGEDFFDYLMFSEDGWAVQERRPNKSTGMSIQHAYECELRMAFAVSSQAERGFRIDTKEAIRLCEEIDKELEDTERQFKPHIPMRLKRTKVPSGEQSKLLGVLGQHLTKKAVADVKRSLKAIGWRVSSKTTKWTLVTKAGSYTSAVTKHYPEARGFITDHKDPLVQGPFTPVDYEEVPLGNRDLVKQSLYKYGWRGVNFNDTELAHIEDKGTLPYPWSGKIDDASIDLWLEKGDVPEWALGIARWYILSSRRNQILNKKDQAFYDEKGHWPRQTNGKHECRGILPKCVNKETGEIAQEYYEENSSWPDSLDEDWRLPARAFACATNTFR